ncbi:hypothetical protein Rt10032_c11g4460 [Rhodotorula toruloides]|uniref:DUF952 domain protein n=1 Tax=Rhodotorula toruloides TaxID=5286 RepID=A0A511KJ94_RHOTO|nr:hypothetical protein Rt10032_c11g4460 [Rhodotorula toruloides]
MSEKQPAPSTVDYVYKIVTASSVNPRYAFPRPIPASHVFALSELDTQDGFIHLSTAAQLPRTLNRFFESDPQVVLLKCDYKRLSGWKVVKWEPASNGENFPHLYAQLEGENVESFNDLLKGQGETSWDSALQRARLEGWLQD